MDSVIIQLYGVNLNIGYNIRVLFYRQYFDLFLSTLIIIRIDKPNEVQFSFQEGFSEMFS